MLLTTMAIDEVPFICSTFFFLTSVRKPIYMLSISWSGTLHVPGFYQLGTRHNIVELIHLEDHRPQWPHPNIRFHFQHLVK